MLNCVIVLEQAIKPKLIVALRWDITFKEMVVVVEDNSLQLGQSNSLNF